MPASPIPLALIITELDPGGAERCLTRLACGLDRGRFAPHVYALGSPPQPPRDELLRSLRQCDVPATFLGLHHAWQLPVAVRRLQRLLRAQQAVVAQAFLYHANVVATAARRRAGVAAISLGLRVSDPSRWRQCVERRLARRADRLVCVSRSVATFARQRLHPAADKLLVIPNGIDLDAMPRQPADLNRLGVPSGQRAIVWAGRLTYQKGLDRLLALAPALLARLPHHDLLLVGDGPGQRELAAEVARQGLQRRVHFAGWQPDVPAILLASDLLVLPSRWEGMPNVVLEAMACRRPVLCAPADGVRELLGPLAADQIADPEDAQTFTEKLVATVSEPAAGARLGSANRQRARACFSLGAMITAYENLFQSLAGRS